MIANNTTIQQCSNEVEVSMYRQPARPLVMRKKTYMKNMKKIK